MMTGPIDYATLFSAAPAGPSQNVKFRQGTILSFNPNTLQNTVSVGGATLTDLPLLGVAEAASFVPGATVGVLVVGDDTSAKTMFILGRSVIPNTVDATNAITLLSQRTYSAVVSASDFTTSVVAGDLANIGPIVPAQIGPSGRALVSMSCTFNYGATNGTAGGFVYITVSGSTVIASLEGPSSHLQATGVAVSTVVIDSKTRVIEIDGLNPGPTTFKAIYAASSAATGCNFANRVLTVSAL